MKKSFIKPNPYAFPFIEFQDLSNKRFRYPQKEKNVDFSDIKKIIKSSSQENIKQLANNRPLEEQIFDFFMQSGVRFGSLSFYHPYKETWIHLLRQNIEKKQITLTILGLPFKVPNPLKTLRNLPDLGEVMSLQRLEFIANTIEDITQIPVKMEVVTEGAFHRFTGLSLEDADAYKDFLPVLTTELGFSHVSFTPLQKIETYIENFELLYAQRVKETKNSYKRSDSEIVKKVEGTFPIILRIVKPPQLELTELMDLYNFNLPMSKLDKNIYKARQVLQEHAINSTIEYFTYLHMRDELGFMKKEFGDSYIPLTVAPKENRIGIIPINKNVTILPHQGVPVFDPKGNLFTIMYYIDLLRSDRDYTKIFLTGDQEDKPFYYQLEA